MSIFRLSDEGLSEEPDVCSAWVLFDEPRERDASSACFLDLDEGARGEFERGDGQLFSRLARAEHFAGDNDDVSVFGVSGYLAEIEDDSGSS